MAKRERPTAEPVEPITPPTAEQGNPALAPEMPNPLKLPLGPPFALSNECNLVDRAEGEQLPPNAGCFATVKCNCGAMWRANLLSEDDKECPSCNALYTHLLVIVPVDDRGVLASILEEVMMAHGLMPEGDGSAELDDDEDDDDDEDEDEDDDTVDDNQDDDEKNER